LREKKNGGAGGKEESEGAGGGTKERAILEQYGEKKLSDVVR